MHIIVLFLHPLTSLSSSLFLDSYRLLVEMYLRQKNIDRALEIKEVPPYVFLKMFFKMLI
jgi:hypothetical protein